MKKRLLIVSIVMLLVIAVTLSTATYAWFTSNASVTASTVTLNAESSGGTALGIGWYGSTTGTSITANSASNYKPMVPSALSVGNTALSSITWSGATIYTDGGVAKFNAPYSPAPVPYTYNGTVSSSTVDVFYIENLSQANAIRTITMTLSDVVDADDLLRVAVFTSSTNNGTFTLQAVLGKSADMNTEWGSITAAGQVVSDLCTSEIQTVTSYVINDLPAQGKVYFKVVAWLDGVALNDSTAESTSTLGLNFLAA